MSRETELKQQYQALHTQALLEIHRSGTLTDEAYRVLEEVLKERLVEVPARPSQPATNQAQQPEWQRRAMTSASRMAQIFAAAGVAIPSVLFCLDYFGAIPVASTGGLMFPAMFVLFLLDWRGGMGPEILLALAANAMAFAGVGWLVGYGLSRSQRFGDD